MVKHDGASREYSYYSYNAHTDVELITKADGRPRATYGYTAYGQNDIQLFTGVDKPDPANPDKKPYNTYRFNAKRLDPATGDYDMGARDYSPERNRFLTRDLYNGALADLSLATDLFTMNRYAFGAGNPISMIEIDGHWGWSDIGHIALDVVGLVPVVGEAADLANAAWYAAEGDYVNAALSAASSIPFAGYAATGAKLAIKGTDAVRSATKASDDVAAAATRSGDNVPTGTRGPDSAAPAPAKAPAAAPAAKPAAAPAPKPAPAPAKVAPSKAPASNTAGDSIPLYKAPPRGGGQRMSDSGFRASDYPGRPGEVPDGFAYFANDRELADQFARHYGEGVIEVQIPRAAYLRKFQQFEAPYQGGPLTELPIPARLVEQLNLYPRTWHR